jgi:hypothetical protein
MKKLVTSSCILLMLAITTFPTLSQENRYDGPNEDDSFFSIGFSSDGNQFAYGWFEVTHMISNASTISIVVRDLRTDKVIYEKKKEWDEGNVGPEDAGWYPSDAKRAWEVIEKEVNKKFVELDIRGGAGAGVLPFPVGDLGLNVEVSEFEAEPGYGVYAFSENLGEKMISSGSDIDDIDLLSVKGYVWNPAEIRIGVIMYRASYGPWSHYYVIGCHTSSGFKKTGQ